jgi:hypothetical protein
VLCVCIGVCVLSHWVQVAIDEGLDLPALKCSSHWSLGLYLASVVWCCVVECCVVTWCDSGSLLHPSTPLAAKGRSHLQIIFLSFPSLLSFPSSMIHNPSSHLYILASFPVSLSKKYFLGATRTSKPPALLPPALLPHAPACTVKNPRPAGRPQGKSQRPPHRCWNT